MQPTGKREIAEAGVTALVVALATALGEILADEVRAWRKRRKKGEK